MPANSLQARAWPAPTLARQFLLQQFVELCRIGLLTTPAAQSLPV